MIEMPKILEMPKKLLPFMLRINEFRYFLGEGGRGGGKSQAVARIILYLAEQKHLRIVCGREIQTSINESVYSLLVDLIRQNNLAFDVFSSKIVHKVTKSTINFRGFREQGVFNIQGMEGVDVIWVDESQAMTKLTLDTLIPTIRKQKAKIYFTMNRHLEHDPAYEMFQGRKDCLHIHINYDENRFCPEALKNEARECRLKSEADYAHIWMGDPLLKLEDCVFTYRELKDTIKNKYPLREGYGLRLGAFDIARYGDDKCACKGIQQMGALHWEDIFTDQWDHKDLNYTTGRILTTSAAQEFNKSIIDEDGIGAGPLDTLNKGRGLENFIGFRNPPLSYIKNKFYGNVRTANVYKLKDLVEKGHIVITDEETIRELCTLRYKYDNYQRKILISKQVMKDKFKVKSPNRADALIMAISLIGEIDYQQQEQYQTLQPAYSKEASLF